MKCLVLVWVVFAVHLMIGLVNGNVVVIGRNVSLTFDDAEAKFSPTIKGSGECGILYVADPLDACTPLINNITADSKSAFVLIIRGGCTFDDKVRCAQEAGFKAAIVYDDEDNDALVSMAGSANGIHIPAVFVTKATGEILSRYAGRRDLELWIIPTYENSLWSIMAISFISLLAISAVLATCFFVHRHRIRREQPIISDVECHGMSSQLVKAMPSLVFEYALEDNCTSTSCAICLDDYNVGDKLRVLPCRHKFHALCVDLWLTSWRTFCPVCKQDARAGIIIPPPSERTPLLSSAASLSSSAALSSFRSSIAASPAIPIIPRPPRSNTSSQPQSVYSSFYVPTANGSYRQSVSPSISINRSSQDIRNAIHRSQSHLQSLSRLQYLSNSHIPSPNRSYNRSPAISTSRSSLDLINSSLHRSDARSYIASSGSLPFPVSSTIAVNYASPDMASSSIGSSSYLAASSSRPSYLRHCTDSATSLSALASAQSLPGC